MKLWGALVVACLCLAAAGPAIDPVPVCDAVAHEKDYDGKVVALLGRYSFRERQGRRLEQDACEGKPERVSVPLAVDSSGGPKPPDQIALDESSLEKKLTAIRQHTTLAKFRFGSADYDRWAVVYGRLEQNEQREMQLVYRGAGAVFFFADK